MKFALLVFYAAGTLAAPVLDDRYPKAEVKEIECTNSRFRPGTTFEYAYAGETINNVEGSTTQATGIQISTRVFITQLEECMFHMRLSDSKLSTKGMKEKIFTESAESAALQRTLESNELFFTMKGATITSLKTRESETTEALNIKRGILSAFQLDDTKTSETDINGKCEYTITKTDGVIVKAKTLSECTDRTLNVIGIQSASIKTGSDLKPLNSVSSCTYSLDAETIRSVVCEEKHLFRPFSAGHKTPSGAMTLVRQKLQFNGYTANEQKYESNGYSIEKNIAFDHIIETKQTETLTEQVEVVIKRLIDQSYLSAKKTSAQEFTSLVMLFRKMNRNKMAATWDKYFDCTKSQVCAPDQLNLKDLYRQYMLDAIAYCGTPSCIAVVKDVAISGEITGERANMFLQSIALVAKTTNSMIRDILEIAQAKPSRQVFLTLGTLISRHCAKSPAECEVQAGTSVIQALNFLEKTLGVCEGQEDHERVEQILITLKAIGNAKRPTNARSALITCAKNSMHANITISAFDALRGMPCDTNALAELRTVIADESLDADKRIYAFQTAMKCPTTPNVQQLVELYNMEKNNQLASFMWTFFTNMLESSDPDTKQAKAVLTAITKEIPLKTTDLPVYQYSKNFEKSLYIDSLKTGATAKANLVFHPDGFLPKTAMFDMTAKVMGVPVDLVETVVGIDGIETVIENAFGPNGVLPKGFNLKMFDWSVSTEKLQEMVEQRVRRAIVKPAASNENPLLNDLHDTVNKKPAKPSGFMSLKVMGQEVRVMSYDDIFAMIDQIDNMNVIQLLLNWAKGGEKTFSKSLMFLEMTHCVPTALGLPLKLKLTGSTVATVEMKGKFDIRSMFWGPTGLNVNGYLKPTAVVDISGKMGIESNLVSTGLLVSSNMMVSNLMKGSINYKEGEILQINMDTPADPVQLFHASSTPFMYMNEQKDMVEGVPRMIKADKCLKSQLIGYGLCTSLRVPVAFRDYEAPYFPLSGPAHVGLSLVRGDEKLTTFQFKTSMTKITNGVEGVIEFSTPGAAYERTLGGKMLYTNVDNDKVLTLSSERVGSVKLSHNTITYTTSLEAKTNVFKKDLVTKAIFFRGTQGEQMGIQVSAELGDLYKFKHVTKYVKSDSGPSLETLTEYAPNKVISAALKYDTQEQKLKATIDINQFRQSAEISAKWDYTATTKGLTLAFVHLPTGKRASLYTAYESEEGKNEIVVNADIFGRPIKNILGLYRDGGKTKLRNFFLFKRQTSTVEATYENRDGMKEIQMNADFFGRRGMANILYTNQGTERVIRITADAAGKRASTTMIITNMEVEKSIRITVDSSGKVAEATLGYYTMRDTTIFKVDAQVLGKKAELFWKLRTTGGYQSTIGGVVGTYVFGTKSMYENSNPNERGVCTSVYYGTTEAEKIAAEGCVKLYNYDSAERIHRQVVCSVDLPEMKKKVSVIKDLVYQANHSRFNIAVRTLLNEDVLCTKRLNVLFESPTNGAIEFEMQAGKYAAGWKAYSHKRDSVIDIGLLMTAMDKKLLFLTQYEEVRAEGEMKAKITSSVILNGAILPVTTTIDYLNRNGEAITSVALNIGKYTIKQTGGLLYGNSRYGFGLATETLIDGERMTKVFVDYVATLTESKMALDNMFGFALKKREFKYGWHVEYENQSFGMKRTHVLKANLQYATKRMSTITLMFADSDKAVSVEVDIEYIPTKKVSHVARFDKERQQLDVSLEVLPAMYVKFMAQLTNKIGYTLTTSTNFEWANFKRVLKFINSALNNEKVFKVSTSFAGDITLALEVNKVSPISITLSATAYENNAKLIATYQNMQVRFDVVVNGKKVAKLEGNYDQVTKSIRMFAVRGEQIMFDITTGYNKVMNAFNFAIAGAKKWGGVNVNTKGPRTVVSFSAMNRGFAKIILNKEHNSLAIQLKSTASFLFKYTPKSNTVSVTMKTNNNRITLMTSADWKGKVVAMHLMVNKERFGIKVLLFKRAINIKLIASPIATMKFIFAFTQNTLKMDIQRITKEKVISEASFKYTLSKETSALLFNWNTETIAKMNAMIEPLINEADKIVRTYMLVAIASTGRVAALGSEAKTEILNFISKLEKAFDNFDFIAARDEVGALTLKALRKLSMITVEALKSLASTLDKIKERVPETVERLRGLIKEIKSLNTNVEATVKEVIAQAKKLILKGREMILKGQQLLKDMKLDESVREILDVVMKVTDNLTEATRPVIEKAITLLKDFKIRGKRLEDIVKMATVEGKKIIEMYKVKVTEMMVGLKTKTIEKINDLKANLITACNKATDYLMKLKVPYTDKTVAQIIEMIMKEIEDIKKKVETMDPEALIKDLKMRAMDYKIKGKTIAEFVNETQAKITEIKTIMETLSEKYVQVIKDLPETTRKTLHQLIAISRKYIDDMDTYITAINTYITKVNKFAEPLLNHIIFVQASITKHMYPIITDATSRIVQAIRDVELPPITPIINAELKRVADFFLPLLKPIVPLYKNLVEQLKGFNVMGFRVGTVLDMQVAMIDSKLNEMVRTTKENMNKQMTILKEKVEQLKKQSPEQFVDNSVETVVKMCSDIVDFLNKMYASREEMTTTTIAAVKRTYNNLKEGYEKVTAKSFDEITEQILKGSAVGITLTTGELSSLVKQVVAMNISGPTWKAWTDADLIGQLERYGVNEKVRMVIESAKKANLTNLIFKTISSVQDFVTASIMKSSVKTLELYRKLETVFNYLKSIPKKDYEAWLDELTQFTVSNKAALEKTLQTIYETSRTRATEAYKILEKMAMEDATKLYEEYLTVAKQWYAVVADKAQLVYDEVKQPTIDVYTHYQTTIMEFVTKQYLVIKKILTTEYKKLYADVNARITELSAIIQNKIKECMEKMESKAAMIKETVEEMYKNFLAKYGDLTWDDVTAIIEKLVLKNLNKAKKEIVKQYERILEKGTEIRDEVKAELLKMYSKTVEEIEKIIKILNTKAEEMKSYVEKQVNEIKPKVMEAYRKYEGMIKLKTEEVVEKAKAMLTEVKAKATDIYNLNKNKTLEQIYNEIKDFVLENYLKQKEYLKALSAKNYEKATQMLEEAKSKAEAMYMKIGMELRTVIIPELMAEAESIINQTLRNTVIMTKEIIKAYTPQAIVARDFAKKYLEIIILKAPALLAKAKGLLKMDLAQLKEMLQVTLTKVENTLKELIEMLKKNEQYKKYVAILEKNVAILKDIIRSQITELSKNPSLLKIKAEIQTKIAELKKFVKEKIEQVMSNPEVIAAKAKVEEMIQILKTCIVKYQKKLDIYVAKVIELLKQLEKSGKFTAEQLKVTLTPHVERLTKDINEMIAALPPVVDRSVQYFTEAPEDAFWSGIAVYREAVIGAIEFAKLYTKKDVINNFNMLYADIVLFSKDLYNKTTDDWTKATIAKLSTEMKVLYGKLIDQYEIILAQGKDLPALMKTYYEKNLPILKTKITELKNWTNEQFVEFKDGLMQFWEISQLKAILTNPIWGELAGEFRNHELIALVNELKDIVALRLSDLKAILFPILKEKYDTAKALVEKNIVMVKENFARAQAEALKMSNKLVEKITWLVNNADEVFKKTTIADIVATLEKQYKEALVAMEDLKLKFDELKTKLMTKAKEMYSKYETEAKEMIGVYKTMITAIIEEYKGKIMPYYTKLMEMYNKYYKEIKEMTTMWVEKATGKYLTIKKVVDEKYKEAVAKTLDLIKEYKTMSIQKLKEIKETLIKTWEESEIRAKLNVFRNMTIRQTIELLKVLPEAIFKDVVAKYNTIVAKVNELCTDCADKVQAELVKIIKMLKPYLDDVRAVYSWVENEVTETGLFVYKYYELEEKYNKVKAIIIAEAKRMIALAKKRLPILREILQKYAAVYKESITKSATKYVTQYRKLVDVYAKQAADMAKATGDKTLRGIHSTLKMADSFDIETVKTLIMDIVKNISKYVVITRTDGELKIEIISKDLKPLLMKFAKQIKINAKEAFKQLNVKVKQMLKNIKVELDDIKEKADKLRIRIQDAVMRNTAEIRRDFNISFKVNKKIVIRIYEAIKAIVLKNYDSAKAKYDMIEKKALELVDTVTAKSQEYYKELIPTVTKLYNETEAIIKDIANAGSPKEMYEKALKYLTEYYNLLKAKAMTMMETYKPLIQTKFETLKSEMKAFYEKLTVLYKDLLSADIKARAQEYLAKLKEGGKVVLAKADETVKKVMKVVVDATKTYYAALETAYKELKAGIPAEEVFRPLLNKIKAMYNKLKDLIQNADIRAKLCANNLEVCKLVDESIAVHKVLITKYWDRVQTIWSVGKAQIDRAVRRVNKQVEVRNPSARYMASAMIMGDHILTFDNKLYNFVDFVKANNEGVSACRYLLARDFQDKKFTIVKSDNAITIETAAMAIKIRQDGRTKTTIGNEATTSLPVESGKSRCVRLDSLILCHFRDERLKVAVDLKNLFTVITISGWYKGKTRGLLGTYNNEGHDEWKLPEGAVTKNINEFINSYELTGKPECQLDIKTDHAPTCIKPMSKKCKKFFVDGNSPFAKYFETLETKPFMELCRQNTKCSKRPTMKSLCGVVASYVTMLRTKGIWVSHPNECMADRGRDVNEEWVQKPMKKAIDVVVMVSQKENMHKMRKRIATTMYQLHRSLKKDKYLVRYALVGFGGAGVHEPAHTHPLRRGQTVFGYILDLNREIKSMPYEGTVEHTNDGYHAILKASRLKFRPGVEKIFIMFNSEPHARHESGPSFDETKYILENEANAPLIVFDTVSVPNLGKDSGRFIGETERKIYTTKNVNGTPDSNLDMPASEFKELIILSKGGLFSNTAIKKPKQAAISLQDVVVTWIKKDIQECKRCVLRNSWTGQSRPICISDSTAEC